MERFGVKTRIFFGEGGLEQLTQLKGKRVFVVTDAFLASSGLLERVKSRLTGEVRVFDAVKPDPTLELAARGVLEFEKAGAEAILAFGGGSPMDCAKAIRYFSGRQVPLWCIPTTAGTGSEVTAFSVLTDGEKGIKYPLVEESLLPDAAILAPEFLEGIPPAVTADTGMDVLAHAAEAWVARGANRFTDALAEAAFCTAYRSLPAAFRGEREGKAAMLEASCMAGMAFQGAGLGICHSLSHALGGMYHLPHGRLNAMLLPRVILWHAECLPAVAKKYAVLAKACGLAPNARALAAALGRIRGALGMPGNLAQPIDIPRITRQAMADRCTLSDPAEVTEAALGKILEGLR